MAQERLTPRQQRFVEAYLHCGVGAQAAREAGYSARSAPSLLEHPAVADAIATAMGEERERLQAVRRQLTADMERLATVDGSILAGDLLQSVPPEIRPLLDVSVTETPYGRTVHYRLPGRLSAMSALARHANTLLRDRETDKMEEEEYDEETLADIWATIKERMSFLSRQEMEQFARKLLGDSVDGKPDSKYPWETSHAE